MRSIRQPLRHCLHLQTHRNNTPSVHKYTIIIQYKRPVMVNIYANLTQHTRGESRNSSIRGVNTSFSILSGIFQEALCVYVEKGKKHARILSGITFSGKKSTHWGNPPVLFSGRPTARDKSIHPDEKRLISVRFDVTCRDCSGKCAAAQRARVSVTGGKQSAACATSNTPTTALI